MPMSERSADTISLDDNDEPVEQRAELVLVDRADVAEQQDENRQGCADEHRVAN